MDLDTIKIKMIRNLVFTQDALGINLEKNVIRLFEENYRKYPSYRDYHENDYHEKMLDKYRKTYVDTLEHMMNVYKGV